MEGRGVDSFVLWRYPRSHYFCCRLWLNVDWVGDSLAAFFGVDVTDLVVDCKSMTEWLTELVTLTALFAVYVTDLLVDCKCLTKINGWLSWSLFGCLVCCWCDWPSGGLTQCLTRWLTVLVTVWLSCLLLMWLTTDLHVRCGWLINTRLPDVRQAFCLTDPMTGSVFELSDWFSTYFSDCLPQLLTQLLHLLAN